MAKGQSTEAEASSTSKGGRCEATLHVCHSPRTEQLCARPCLLLLLLYRISGTSKQI